MQGVGFRPYVYRLAGELGPGRIRAERLPRRAARGRGRRAAVERFLARLAPERRRWRWSSGWSARPASRSATAASRSVASPQQGERRRRRSPPTPRPAPTACASCSTRATGGTATRSPTAPTAVRGSRSSGAFPTTARARRWRAFRCARAAGPSTTTRPTGASTPSPTRARSAGRSVSLVSRAGDPVRWAASAIRSTAAAAALRDGRIVAVKGIGGFHLACRADDEAAVAALRARKHREDKPFALMAAVDRAAAEALVQFGRAGARRCCSAPERPIVLAAARAGRAGGRVGRAGRARAGRDAALLAAPPPAACRLRRAGAGDDQRQRVGRADRVPRRATRSTRLSGIADLLLVHDRPIETRTDDSVVRVVTLGDRRQAVILRRSRGYVPASLALPVPTACPMLACGAELKNTFCVARGARAWVGHHIGDLENYETLASFTEGIEHFQRLFAVTPEVVAPRPPSRVPVDQVRARARRASAGRASSTITPTWPPCSPSTASRDRGRGDLRRHRLRRRRHGVGRRAAVRRHRRLRARRALLCRCGCPEARRRSSSRGGWRCAWLAAGRAIRRRPPCCDAASTPRAWGQVARLAETGLGSPVTTSMGRLFDAVAALCGLRLQVNYEGQAAIELEAACDPAERGRYPIELTDASGMLVIDPRETIARHRPRSGRRCPGRGGRGRFHGAVAAATVQACAVAAATAGTERVVLSGGVFQNRRLIEAVAAGLQAGGCACSCPSGCRSTTAGSPSARPRSRARMVGQ